MAKYVIKRILSAIPLMLVIVLVIFFMMQVIPGNPISVMMGEKASPAVIERVTEEMGLNDPMIVRFTNYVRDALHGDFGRSYKLNREVSDLIWEAFPNTVILAVTASLVAWIIGIPAGIVSAVKKDSLLDRGLMGFSLTGISLPVFWVAMLVQWVFGYQLGWFPISGYTTPLHKVLPALVLGWSSAGSIARMTRSNLLETLRNDFVRTARAKGLSGKGVIWKHALKNAMMPVVTMMAIQFASMLSGAILTESVFGIGGIGQLAVSAINTRDMPLLAGTTLFSTIITILGNMAADILYCFIDPRIREA